jgi:hypothetical protein
MNPALKIALWIEGSILGGILLGKIIWLVWRGGVA